MKYGTDFAQFDRDGRMLDKPVLTGPLDPFFYPDGDQGWYLERMFLCAVKIRDVWNLIRIMDGFDYDGASIPRIARSVIGDKMDLRMIVPALLHDAMYCAHRFDRTTTDWLFREVMEIYDNNMARRGACWSAVASCGWAVWYKSTEELVKYRAMIQVRPMPVGWNPKVNRAEWK